MIDKYLSNVRDISESTREDFHSSSSSLDGSNEDEKELCVYIKNYIDDRDEVGISLYTTRESRKLDRRGVAPQSFVVDRRSILIIHAS